MSYQICLRPFTQYLEREQHRDMLAVTGRIEGKRFIVSAIGFDIGFDAVVTDDDLGPVALVDEQEQTLPNGFKVRIEVEPDEELPSGGVISVFLEGRAHEKLREQVQSQGIDPETVLLLAPHERHFAVYFNGAGFPNGKSSSYLGNAPKTVIN